MLFRSQATHAPSPLPAGFTCPSVRLCIEAHGSGVATTTTPAGTKPWTPAPLGLPLPRFPLTVLGCASASLCVVGDQRGDLYTGTSAGRPRAAGPSRSPGLRVPQVR